MKTPDITQAQVLAFLTWAGAQAVAYGLLTSAREQLLLSVTATALAIGWKLADAYIRRGRSGLALELLAEAHQLRMTALRTAAGTSDPTVASK